MARLGTDASRLREIVRNVAYLRNHKHLYLDISSKGLIMDDYMREIFNRDVPGIFSQFDVIYPFRLRIHIVKEESIKYWGIQLSEGNEDDEIDLTIEEQQEIIKRLERYKNEKTEFYCPHPIIAGMAVEEGQKDARTWKFIRKILIEDDIIYDPDSEEFDLDDDDFDEEVDYYGDEKYYGHEFDEDYDEEEDEEK